MRRFQKQLCRSSCARKTWYGKIEGGSPGLGKGSSGREGAGEEQRSRHWRSGWEREEENLERVDALRKRERGVLEESGGWSVANGVEGEGGWEVPSYKHLDSISIFKWVDPSLIISHSSYFSEWLTFTFDSSNDGEGDFHLYHFEGWFYI